jgi:predicted kinase
MPDNPAPPETRARLIIVCGLPGSGKTTLARGLEQRLGAVRLAPDEWMATLRLDLYDEASRARVEALQWQIGQRLLALGQIVIIEWGTWARDERDTLRLGARALGAGVELRYLAESEEVLWQRIERRAQEQPPITMAMVAEWAALFQAPTEEEVGLFDPPLQA